MIPVRVDYRVKGLGTPSRLLVFAACAAAGVAVQVFLPGLFLLGTALLALPLALLAARPWTNKPDDQGEEDWQPAGIAELDRIADAFRSSAKIRIPFWYRPFSGLPLTIILGFLTAFSAPLDGRISLVFLDVLLLLWPTLHFLRIKIWIPRNLEMSMRCVLAALSAELPPGVVVTPYLRLDRDANGLRIPEDVRLMVEPRRSPDDLVGVQVQCTINNGPHGPVPYLYAVVLTRGKGPTWRIAAALRPSGFEVESGGEGEYGTVVLRQKTSGGGYHTDEDDCRRLMRVAVEFLRAVSPEISR
jgi:hypothetical protein